MKRILILMLLCFLAISSLDASVLNAAKVSEDILQKSKNMSIEELFKSGDSLRMIEDYTSSLFCYSMIYNSQIDPKDTALMQILCKALNSSAVIYFFHYDYISSLQFYLRALDIAQELNYKEYKAKIYSNMGGIYYEFKDYKTAKKYYQLSYKDAENNYLKSVVLNNLALLSYRDGDFKFALSVYKQSHSIIKEHCFDTLGYDKSLNNIGNVYRSLGIYDSARMFYQMALENAQKLKVENEKALIFSNFGNLYFEKQKYDSAVHYLNLSMNIAKKYNLLTVLSDNYLVFSKIQEAKGSPDIALIYYKKYLQTSDSVHTTTQYAKVNNLLFSYDLNKINKEVERLHIEQEIKERTIIMQRFSQLALALLLILVVISLILVYRKNQTLYQAYNILVKKNKQIIESEKLNYRNTLEYEDMLMEKEALIHRLQEQLLSSDSILESIEESVPVPVPAPELDIDMQMAKKPPISDEMRRVLERKVLEIMNKQEIFCDKDFSLTKLAEQLDSNLSYISWVINHSFNKNFNTFINEYRIKEACRLFADPEYSKYSIESISSMVGFRHKSSFNPAFKEFTGVAPSFYIRSLKNQEETIS